jgi:hypothetical protein
LDVVAGIFRNGPLVEEIYLHDLEFGSDDVDSAPAVHVSTKRATDLQHLQGLFIEAQPETVVAFLYVVLLSATTMGLSFKGVIVCARLVMISGD